MDKNKVRFGLSNVYIALFDEYDEEGVPQWETPIHIPGAVNMNTTEDSQENTFHADNIPYYSTWTDGAKTADLEMAKWPDEILAALNGWIINEIGAVIKKQGGQRRTFALMYQIEGDISARRAVYYNCTAGALQATASTITDTTEPNTETLPISMTPMNLGNGVIAHQGVLPYDPSTIGNQSAYNAFFSAVPIFDVE